MPNNRDSDEKPNWMWALLREKVDNKVAKKGWKMPFVQQESSPEELKAELPTKASNSSLWKQENGTNQCQ